ncbi:sodium-independent anion transporter [Microbulbifer flavimaris]|uniref:Sodium-independent anion transporter n=1 Tax=Microbulbifer flavimaris TaxID=1781068 RepID=A0ABX4HWC0_9GAMM|nr:MULTISPECIES: sulfate permease [Microbulbifer]KUJ80251.1 sulfate:proton symporter [Microbulbifer sp. ZGT114]PCO04316.1 sodium-independent anion transporter [Microbulbifer flavimaris]
MQSLAKFLPISGWLRDYDRTVLSRDLMAAVIVTIMLIPQSLAYGLLAGVPAEVGLYASIVPLLAYAVFGTSRTLSVGPVAVASLMSAAALSEVAIQGTADYLVAAAVLALLSGLFLTLMGLLRLGFLANFLSHPVISGFITASGILIALSQVRHILGIGSDGDTLLELLSGLLKNAAQLNVYTLITGLAVIAFLYWSRSGAARLLRGLNLSAHTAGLVTKAAPVLGVVATIAAAVLLDFEGRNVALVGTVPAGLPSLHLPTIDLALIETLLPAAIMISIIGYVESVSVGKTLAAKRRQRIDMNQELVGLGVANIGSGFSGAFPVTGGFSRSVVNFDAGAETQMASVFTAVGIALASIFLTPFLYYLPKATLAATIIVAVLSLVDFSILRKTWRFSRSDFFAVLITIVVTLLFGVEAGVTCGVAASIGLFLFRTSKPHIAEVGLVEGTEHFRNIKRHKVLTVPEVLTIRVDESLMFSNAAFLEERVYSDLANNDRVRQVILMCSAINEIDWSALEVLEALNDRLGELGITLHLSEVKGPVMDSLQRTGFLQHLTGRVYLTQYQAFNEAREAVAADS